MTEQHSDELDLLDIAVFVAQHWVFIFLVPAVLAVAAFFVAGQTQRTYTATTTIALPASSGLEATDPIPMIVSNVGYAANRLSDDRVSVTVQGGNITVSSSGDDPQVATDRLRNAIHEIARAGQVEIDEQQIYVSRSQSNLERLDAAIGSADAEDITPAALATTETMRARVATGVRQIELAQSWLAGITSIEAEVRDTSRSPRLTGLLTLVLSGVVTASACAIRAWWRRARISPITREKINRIRAAFWLPPV